jgi:hypothetical protein
VSESRCECCDLPTYSCGRAKAATQRKQEQEHRKKLQACGWFPARWPGKCGVCEEWFAVDTLITAGLEPGRWIAECCADRKADAQEPLARRLSRLGSSGYLRVVPDPERERKYDHRAPKPSRPTGTIDP